MGVGFELVTAQVTVPAIIVHGGAGAYLKTTTLERRQARGRTLASVAAQGLAAGEAQDAVLAAVCAMELDPGFNAGRGSKLQRDGQVRVSAALMDGRRTRMSSVFNVRGCLHPSRLAQALQERGDRNLDGTGGELLMKELGVVPQELRTERTRARWRSLVSAGDTADPEAAIGDTGREELDVARRADLPVPEDLEQLRQSAPPEDPNNRYGTVGAVAVDASGEIWACTSTGGRGHETPGRVSDSGMPAGNYACPRVAISATGFGEQIIDLNVCGRIATRVLDGASLERALARTFEEVVAMGGLMGVIAMTDDGQVGYAYSTEACGVAWLDASGQSHIDKHGR